MVWAHHSHRWSAWPPLPPPPPRAHEVGEVERVLRATHAFGVLNLPVRPRHMYPRAEVERAFRNACGRMRGVLCVRRREAYLRLQASCRLLTDANNQRTVRDRLAHAGLRPVTRSMRCSVDMAAVREYVDGAGADADEVPRRKDGTSYGLTRRQVTAHAPAPRLPSAGRGPARHGMGSITLPSLAPWRAARGGRPRFAQPRVPTRSRC